MKPFLFGKKEISTHSEFSELSAADLQLISGGYESESKLSGTMYECPHPPGGYCKGIRDDD